MKNFLILLITTAFCCGFAHAQTVYNNGSRRSVKRNIPINYVSGDSVKLALNEDFELVADSCSEVIRYAHINAAHQFFGKFKDVSSIDPGLVITQGNYNADGQKDGYFEVHYLNGKLRATGSFKNDMFDGKWKMYYEDGRPKVFFDATRNDIMIIDAWDEKGVKTVDNGNGIYRADLGAIYWKGKLVNGRPDGTWAAMKPYDVTNTKLAAEKYKDGVFQSGKGPLGRYTDATRIAWLTPGVLPFTHAELLKTSRYGCNSVKPQYIVRARFIKGTEAFNDAIRDILRRYFAKSGISRYQGSSWLTLTGKITENGNIINLMADDAYNSEFVSHLVTRIGLLPALLPATADDKPVEEKFSITFDFESGYFSFQYHFGEIEYD